MSERGTSGASTAVGTFRVGVREWLDAHDLTPAPAAGHSLDAQVAQLSRVRRALYDAG